MAPCICLLDPVASILNFTCQTRTSVVVNTTSGYISSLPVTESGYGSAKCPLVIQGQPGQTINFTLFGLSIPERVDSTNAVSPRCPYYAIVHDNKLTNLSLCASEHRRTESIYVSKGHMVTFHIEKRPNVETAGQALLRYEGRSIHIYNATVIERSVIPLITNERFS